MKTMLDVYKDEINIYVNEVINEFETMIDEKVDFDIAGRFLVQDEDGFHKGEIQGMEELLEKARNMDEFNEILKGLNKLFSPVVFTLVVYRKNPSIIPELKHFDIQPNERYMGFRFETLDMVKMIVAKVADHKLKIVEQTDWRKKEQSELEYFYLEENYSELADILKDYLGHDLN